MQLRVSLFTLALAASSAMGKTSTSTTVTSSPNPSQVGQAVTFNVQVRGTTQTPVSIWPITTRPAVIDENDGQAVELGLKFRANVNGYVTGVRFYKAVSNTGPHTGSLWSSTGPRLATVTFANETSTGWQQANFTTPVAITASVTYIVSYYAPRGHYSVNLNYFTGKNALSGPLEALASGADGPNGVYRYGASGFPTSTYYGSNYWVDVLFAPSIGTAPTGAVSLFDGATALGTATLNNGMASLPKSALAAGTHSITASYNGDSAYYSSTSPVLVHTVNIVSTNATTTSVTSSRNPSTSGQAVTFTAKVTAANGSPSGTVQFLDGSTVIGTGTLSSGSHAITVNSLTPGTHSIRASYLGNNVHAASASAALFQVVNATQHSVSLLWNASTSSNITGYNVYRATISRGPYTKLNSLLVPGLTYTDFDVQGGQTYYYVCTAVNSSNSESVHSNEAQAIVNQ